MENESRGVLAFVNAQPLSPHALIHCRPSCKSGFSEKPLIAPKAPAFTSSHLSSAGLTEVSTSLPRRSCRANSSGDFPFNSTTSAVTPSGGVGPLHIPMDDG